LTWAKIRQMSFVQGQYFISRISFSVKEKAPGITTLEVVLLLKKGETLKIG
jgi:hypothetical protein